MSLKKSCVSDKTKLAKLLIFHICIFKVIFLSKTGLNSKTVLEVINFCYSSRIGLRRNHCLLHLCVLFIILSTYY